LVQQNRHTGGETGQDAQGRYGSRGPERRYKQKKQHSPIGKIPEGENEHRARGKGKVKEISGKMRGKKALGVELIISGVDETRRGLPFEG